MDFASECRQKMVVAFWRLAVAREEKYFLHKATESVVFF